MPLRNTKRRNRATKKAPPASLRTYRLEKITLQKPGGTEPIVINVKRSKARSGEIALLKRKFRHLQKTEMPQDLKPMLATLTDAPFNDKNWQFEIKWDGYRALAYQNGNGVQLRSRNNLSFNHKYPIVAQALQEWGVKSILDGEIVVLSEEGKADFGALQNWHIQEKGKLAYFVFDLLWLDGIDLRNEPLSVRREILKKVLPDSGLIRYSDSIDECGTAFYDTAKSNGLEGIIAKQMDAPYITGNRSENWLKIKAETRQEALICGYTKKKGSERLISSLILGIPKDGILTYIGQVGTGFTGRMLQELFQKMNPLFTSACPFSNKPKTGAPTMWVQPRLVCEVKFTELTKDGLMRHPSFQGLREDKTADELNIEDKTARTSKKQLPKAPLVITDSLFYKKGQETAIVSIENQKLSLTNLTKLYWPTEKLTKGDLLHYYHQMAPFILPFMMDRPQSLNRFPNGIAGKSFYQKDMKGKVEPWLKTFERFGDGSVEAKDFLVCTGAASLLYMANLGCIEMNPWHSRTASPHHPDWCVIDLDPGAISFERVIQTANVVNELLKSLNIPSYPKTSGSTGMHIYIPLGARYTYEQSRQLAELIATLVHEELPSFTSLIRNPEKRKDKIYIDYLQNRPIQTICAPYSVRPKPGATVSAPVHWEEVKRGLKLSQFTIHTMPDRIRHEGDLFKAVLQEGIDLQKVLTSLSAML